MVRGLESYLEAEITLVKYQKKKNRSNYEVKTTTIVKEKATFFTSRFGFTVQLVTASKHFTANWLYSTQNGAKKNERKVL